MALAWVDQYTDVLASDALFVAALEARKLNEQCAAVLKKQLDAVEAALAINQGQTDVLSADPTLGPQRPAGAAVVAPIKRTAVGTPYWQRGPDEPGPEYNADVATPGFLDRKARLRQVYVNGAVVEWHALERQDLVKQAVESVRYRMKTAALKTPAATTEAREIKMTRVKEISQMDIGSDEIDATGVDWGFVMQRLKSTRVKRSALDCQIQFMHWDHPRVSKAPWSKEEEKKLLTIDTTGRERAQASNATIRPAGERNWEAIARRLETGRTPQQCLCHYQSCLNSRLMKHRWTKEEDAALLAAVQEHGAHDWKKLSLLVSGRTANQLMQRHRNIYQPRKTGRWNADEDALLLGAVTKVRQQHGQDVWVEVAKLVLNRTDRQCRERFVRVIDPALRKGEWAEIELKLLESAHANFGDNWSKISEYLKANGVNRADPDVQRRVKILKPEAKAAGKKRTKIKEAKVGHFATRVSRRVKTAAALADEDFVEVFNLVDGAAALADEDSVEVLDLVDGEPQISGTKKTKQRKRQSSSTATQNPKGPKKGKQRKVNTVASSDEVNLVDGEPQNTGAKKRKQRKRQSSSTATKNPKGPKKGKQRKVNTAASSDDVVVGPVVPSMPSSQTRIFRGLLKAGHPAAAAHPAAGRLSTLPPNGASVAALGVMLDQVGPVDALQSDELEPALHDSTAFRALSQRFGCIFSWPTVLALQQPPTTEADDGAGAAGPAAVDGAP